jgi:glycosyltransferase involved in cell wall biosynthesis
VLVSDIEENMAAIGDGGVAFRSKSVEDQTEKLSFLLKSSDVTAALDKRALDIVCTQNNWERVINRYEQLYSRLLTAPHYQPGYIMIDH